MGKNNSQPRLKRAKMTAPLTHERSDLTAEEVLTCSVACFGGPLCGFFLKRDFIYTLVKRLATAAEYMCWVRPYVLVYIELRECVCCYSVYILLPNVIHVMCSVVRLCVHYITGIKLNNVNWFFLCIATIKVDNNDDVLMTSLYIVGVVSDLGVALLLCHTIEVTSWIANNTP